MKLVSKFNLIFIVFFNENSKNKNGWNLLVFGGMAYIPNPFDEGNLNTEYLAISIIKNLYSNAKLSNMKYLTLDDVADASYPSIDKEFYEPCTENNDKLTSKTRNSKRSRKSQRRQIVNGFH